jgi:hypothetical protein
MELHRIGVKFFAANPGSVRMEDFVPVFHRWIQEQKIDGHLLIDIHDYSHLHDGPGILLVAHEGNFSIDSSEGRLGLMYYRKTLTGLAPVDHVTMILRSALQACRLLQNDGHMRFDMNEFVVFANDRLNAPNDEATSAALHPLLSAALRQAFEGAAFQLAHANPNSKDRLAVVCTRQLRS